MSYDNKKGGTNSSKQIIKLSDGSDVRKLGLFVDRYKFARIQIFDNQGILIQALLNKGEVGQLLAALREIDAQF